MKSTNKIVIDFILHAVFLLTNNLVELVVIYIYNYEKFVNNSLVAF